jgi:putative DNA primase/helicase
MMLEAYNQFRAAIRDRLGVDPGPVALDGRLRRFATKANGKDEAGWAIGYGDGVPAGAFGDWRSGIHETWCARDPASLTATERESHRRQMAEMMRQREEERQRVQREAAAKAARIWSEAEPASPAHPYLKTKGVEPFGVRQHGSSLVIPVRIGGELASLQFVGADGGKRFLTGGAIAGGYHSFGKPAGQVIVCEGYATGATLHTVTGNAVAVAFNAGNLEAVAEAIRAKLPDAKIIIAADDDYETDGNPGLAQATKAAAKVGGMVAASPFDRAAGEAGTDWNDLAGLHGPEAMRQRFERIVAAPASCGPVYQLPRWPVGFDMREAGLFREGGDDKPDEWISGPFHLAGEARDPDNGAWSLALGWRDRDGVQHHALIAKADLLGDGVDCLRPFAARGLELPVSAAKVKALKVALAGVRSDARVRLVNRTGWHGSVFVLPSRTFGTAAESVIYQGEARAARYGEAGTLEEWRDRIAARAAGNSRLVLALSVAFAGPLADLMEDEPGGVHFVGASSSGKSTALIVAGSVWGGGGRNGFAQTWRATGNGLEGVAKAHSGTMLALDELGELDAREAGTVAYALMNGQGKARSGRDGEARARAEWRCMILSTGEIRLADKIEEAGRKVKQGQLVRFVDVPADAGRGLGLFEDCHGESPDRFAATMKADAVACYGVAGPAFLDALARDAQKARTAASAEISRTAQAWTTAQADGQVMRVARRFAMIGAAGEVARVALALPWDEGEAMAAARTCFDAWLGWRGGDGAGEIAAAIDAIREAVERHGDGRFVAVHDGERTNPSALIRDALGFRLEQDGERLWAFTRTGWHETLRGVCDPAWAARELAAADVLMVTPSQASQHQLVKKIAGEPKRLFAVKALHLNNGAGA